MVQNLSDQAAIPEKSLGHKVIYTEGLAKFNVGYCFVQGEVSRKEGDEDIASWPVFDICRWEVRKKRAYQGDLGSPSSRITLSPKTLTSTVPLDLSTRRVRISLIAFERALTSIAHIPRTIVGFWMSFPKYRSDV